MGLDPSKTFKQASIAILPINIISLPFHYHVAGSFKAKFQWRQKKIVVQNIEVKKIHNQMHQSTLLLLLIGFGF